MTDPIKKRYLMLDDDKDPWYIKNTIPTELRGVQFSDTDGDREVTVYFRPEEVDVARNIHEAATLYVQNAPYEAVLIDFFLSKSDPRKTGDKFIIWMQEQDPALLPKSIVVISASYEGQKKLMDMAADMVKEGRIQFAGVSSLI